MTLLWENGLYKEAGALWEVCSDLWSFAGTARDDADFDSSFLDLAECLKKYLLNQQTIIESLEMDAFSY